MDRKEKLKKLEQIILEQERLTIALSGGVDSAFLLAFAREKFLAAGRGDMLAALTAVGPQFASDETELATQLCDALGISHKKIDVSHIVNMIKRNPEDRCYHCKRELFGVLSDFSSRTMSVLADGSNASDMADYRPGFKAIEELGVLSPLKEAGLTKDEIRASLRELGEGSLADAGVLSLEGLWEKPAFACLATRIPYGETITERKLEAIYEAEQWLRSQGFTQLRVRCHEIAGNISGSAARFMARVELLPSEMHRVFDAHTTRLNLINKKLKALGFEYVTLDLGGYEMGKMNSTLSEGRIPREGDESGAAGARKTPPDRIEVTETVHRGKAENVETSDVLAEIDRFLKETRETKYSFEDFVDVIEKLRMPDGCPWDREQTHESLKKHMVEEVNEALEAIDEKDWNHLSEELGDVLLQIVLHAQIAKEAGEFSIEDVVQCVSEKMIRRHPHVFGNIDVSSVDEGLDLWEEIKKREKMMK